MRVAALILLLLGAAACSPSQPPPSVDSAVNTRLGVTFDGEPIYFGQGELQDRAVVLYYFATG
jgi:hypothetical protein